MKKIAIIGTLMIGFATQSVWADAANNLKKRLDKIHYFHANFTQKVIDSDGNTIQESQGRLWVKRPNLFNFHISKPDESVLISDGETLWFYNPFVKQVTATWLKHATNNTPFMLIIRNATSDWEQYNIKQIGDNFELTPKRGNINLNQITISVSNSGTINRFCAIEQSNQHINYQLTSQKKDVIDASKFTFIHSQNVTIDDQRNDD